MKLGPVQHKVQRAPAEPPVAQFQGLDRDRGVLFTVNDVKVGRRGFRKYIRITIPKKALIVGIVLIISSRLRHRQIPGSPLTSPGRVQLHREALRREQDILRFGARARAS
jgi:hypothetical protein